MELDELLTSWSRHEQKLLESTRINRTLLSKLLIQNTEKRIDWIKIRSVLSLIIHLPLLVFIVLPRIQFTLEPDFIIGFVLFASLYIISYIWIIKLHFLVEKLNLNESLTTVSKQLRIVEKYKLKITRNGFILAPFMIIGIFLSAGIPFLSTKMIPFYALMLIVFLVSIYIRTKHGLVARLRKLEKDIEEISLLET